MKVRVGCRENNTGASHPGAVLASISKEPEREAVSRTGSHRGEINP